ncbi:glutamine amidotransferase-domain-containing protein [Candidatus Mycoplasma haematolamae str. Purdue]|uniref:Glutamine amidotransferase-domain-containing protein n=1 Tax=Mycoplasma haematolamae (strain Purdue) TaxID=1212765 RepID=I7CEP2_MYCHA|nr:DJ-1/PfpI family protein [Candidatus Mycoplasma haematolamae]AFO51716.1 glutamine amidotransferase-domain-containing protein [Candidatus Mycoplasma haematolamae str. Purdue]
MGSIKRIGILVTNNMEDMEFIIPFDIWKRAKYIVDTISCETKNAASMNYSNIKIAADLNLSLTNLDQYDMLFFPGGPGFRSYLNPPATAREIGEAKLHSTIKKFYKNENKWLVAICAAPIALTTVLEKELEEDFRFTCYNDPKLIGDLSPKWLDQPIHFNEKRKVVTAQAASCATQLAFTIVELFSGMEEAQRIAKSVLYDYQSSIS